MFCFLQFIFEIPVRLELRLCLHLCCVLDLCLIPFFVFFVSDFLLKLVEISLLRIVVMDRGSIAEMDSPAQLIRLKGHFYQMCLGAGLA